MTRATSAFLDVLRLGAAFTVFLAHTVLYWNPRLVASIQVAAHDAVIVFFVLSGFLITGILLRYRDQALATQQSKWHYFGVFYSRRMLRIFPIYYLAILIAALVGYAPVRNNLIWHLTYTSNMYMAIKGVTLGNATHLWSLCVEEQFYLLWPLIVIFTPPRFLRRLAVLMIVAGVAYEFVGACFGLGWVATNYTLFGCVVSLGLGALIAINQHQHDEVATKRLMQWGSSVGLIVLIILQVIYAKTASISGDVRYQPYYEGFIDAAISFSVLPILVAAATNSAGIQAAVLKWAPLRYIGKISYGIYLYHYFLQPCCRSWPPKLE